MADQYLYRLSGADETLLYIGVSGDWTRRMREHWRDKLWATDILNVRLETHPNRYKVLAAERAAITTERPLYNIQHNHSLWDPDDPPAPWTAEDILMAGILIVVAGYVIYKASHAAISYYRARKAEREEFREWRRLRTNHAADGLAPEPPTRPDEDQDAQPTAAPLLSLHLPGQQPPPTSPVGSPCMLTPPNTPLGILAFAAIAFFSLSQTPHTSEAGAQAE